MAARKKRTVNPTKLTKNEEKLIAAQGMRLWQVFATAFMVTLADDYGFSKTEAMAAMTRAAARAKGYMETGAVEETVANEAEEVKPS